MMQPIVRRHAISRGSSFDGRLPEEEPEPPEEIHTPGARRSLSVEQHHYQQAPAAQRIPTAAGISRGAMDRIPPQPFHHPNVTTQPPQQPLQLPVAQSYPADLPPIDYRAVEKPYYAGGYGEDQKSYYADQAYNCDEKHYYAGPYGDDGSNSSTILPEPLGSGFLSGLIPFITQTDSITSFTR
eukprot:sb/3471555/